MSFWPVESRGRLHNRFIVGKYADGQNVAGTVDPLESEMQLRCKWLKGNSAKCEKCQTSASARKRGGNIWR